MLIVGDLIIRHKDSWVSDIWEDYTLTCLLGAMVVDLTKCVDRLLLGAGGGAGWYLWSMWVSTT